jgi:target of rapamycin complex 2 subunit MAPKAP1
MYLQEALEIVCAKRGFKSGDYTLVTKDMSNDMSVFVALDRTVASLQGQSELLLVKKEMVSNLRVNIAQPAGTSADPNCMRRLSMTMVAK